MKVKRFLKELFNPGLKCKRLRHSYEVHEYKISVRSDSTLSILEVWRAKRNECSRCHKKGKMSKKEFLTSFNSVSMPESYWDRLDSDGFLIEKEFE